MTASGFPENAIRLATQTVWLGEDGIVRCVVSAGAHQGREDAVAGVEAVRRVGGTPRPLIVDMRHISGITREARQVYASNEVEITAVALLVESPVSRIIANFFLGFNKASVPARLFANEQDAVLWLKGGAS